MSRSRFVLFAGLYCCVIGGCSKQDADGLSLVGRRVADRIELASGGSHGKLATSWRGARASWGESQLDNRVFLRLQWDKDLASSAVQVELIEPKVIQVGGAVTSSTLRQRAVQLAQSTVGVEKVIEKWE